MASGDEYGKGAVKMKRIAMCSFVILALAVGAAVGQADEISLRYKFEAGQVFKTIEIVKGNLPLEVRMTMPGQAPAGAQPPGNMAVDVALDVTTHKVTTVKSVDENGVATISLKVEYMLMETNTQIGAQAMTHRMEFEDGELTTSGTGGQEMPPEKLAKLKELLNMDFQALMDPLGGVKPIGADFAEIWKQTAGDAMSGVDFRQLTRATTGLPEEAVEVGESWENEYTTGEDEAVVAESTLTLLAVEDGAAGHVAKIRAESSITIQDQEARPAAGGMMPGMMEGMESKLEFLGVTMVTDIMMDLDLGQVTKASADITMNMDQTITMDLGKITGGGQAAKMEIEVKIRDGKMKSNAVTVVE